MCIRDRDPGKGMEAKIEEVMLAMLDKVADAINAPEVIKALDQGEGQSQGRA